MNKVLHVFPYEKFTFDYISQIERCFDPQNHTFYIYGKKPSDFIKTCARKRSELIFVENIRVNDACNFIRLCKEYDKIIFHSLFLPPVFLTVCSLWIKKLEKKSFWNIWGADLYDSYWSRKNKISHRIRELIRIRFITRIRAVGYIYSDYEKLKEWYGSRAKFYLANYSYDFIDIPQSRKKHKGINILVGNSATQSCQHIDAFNLISSLKLEEYNVYCVLSYPQNNKEYISQVVSYGEQLFGDRFYPLTTFSPYEEYMSMLSKIDIAIFNNNRQQALGNIASLLFYGKKVFVNPMNGCFDYFLKMGAHLYSTNDLTKELILKEESKCFKIENQKNILNFYSDVSFTKRWEKIFESEYEMETN